MEKIFNSLSEKLINSLEIGEHLKVSINGELSQFIRFTQSKVRQSGLVDDAALIISLIKDGRNCSGSFTLSGIDKSDEKTAIDELNRLRLEVSHLPQDPFIVFPEDTGSSRENHSFLGVSEPRRTPSGSWDSSKGIIYGGFIPRGGVQYLTLL